MIQRILAALGRINDRLKTSEERIKAIETKLENAEQPATKEEVILIRESLIEVRSVVEDSSDMILSKHPVPLPGPSPFDLTLEDF